jgi:phage-related protein
MARMPKVEIALLADAGAMVRGFRQGKDAADEFEGVLGKTQKAVGVMDKAIAGAAVALGGAFVVALKTGVESLMAHEKADAQTAAAIKSTGGAANISAKQISSMADALEKKTGIDDVAIKQGSNLLLTFTKIRNEAGAGNDIFNQTTSIMTDVATAMGKDPTSAAMMLGKALNDPVKGVGALGRAGVQFTKEQKDQIKTLVESGRTMDAQKMILKELETQFGGSAEAAGKTFGGRLNILKARLEEVAESVAARLMPVLMAIMDWAERNWPQIEKALEAMFDVLMSIGRAIFDVAYPAVRAIFGFLNENRGVAIALVAVLGSLYVGFKALMVARAVAGAVQLLNLAFLANPIVLIVAGVVALGAALVIAYKKSESFRNIVNRVGDVLRGVLMPIFGAVKSAIEAIGALLQGDLGGFLGKLGDVLKNLFEAGLKTVFALPAWLLTQAKDVGIELIEKVAEGAKDIATKVWNAIKNLAVDLASNAASWVTELLGIGKSVVSGILSGVTGLASGIWDKVKAMPAALAGLVVGWFTGLGDIGGKVIDWIVSGISGLASAVWNKIIGFPAALARLVVGWFSGDDGLPAIGGRVIGWIVSGVTGLASAIWDKISNMPGALLKLIAGWAGEVKDIGGKVVDWIVEGIKQFPGALAQAIADIWPNIPGLPGPESIGLPAPSNPSQAVSDARRAQGSEARRVRLAQLQRNAQGPNTPGGRRITAAEQSTIDSAMRLWDSTIGKQYGLARGGLVMGPTSALIGEAGREAVVPLDNPIGIRALGEALQLAGGGGRNGTVINLTLNGVLDAKDAARMLRPELDRLVRLAV